MASSRAGFCSSTSEHHLKSVAPCRQRGILLHDPLRSVEPLDHCAEAFAVVKAFRDEIEKSSGTGENGADLPFTCVPFIAAFLQPARSNGDGRQFAIRDSIGCPTAWFTPAVLTG